MRCLYAGMAGYHGLSQDFEFQGDQNRTPPLSPSGESPDEDGNPSNQQRVGPVSDAGHGEETGERGEGLFRRRGVLVPKRGRGGGNVEIGGLGQRMHGGMRG